MAVTPLVELGEVKRVERRRTQSSSLLLSSFVPSLRRIPSHSTLVFPSSPGDSGDDMPALSRSQRTPLITLQFSSPTFLNAKIYDDLTRNPLYVIRTVGCSTFIERSDPWDAYATAAEVQWPKKSATKVKGQSQDVLVQIAGGKWTTAEIILKPGSLLSSRKFYVPQYTDNLKWKKTGSSYHCLTRAVKLPVAIYEPATTSTPPRLKIFDTLSQRPNIRLLHRGVAVDLLDYILLTCLFLVTDIHAWSTLSPAKPQVTISRRAYDLPRSSSNLPRISADFARPSADYSRPVRPSADSSRPSRETPPQPTRRVPDPPPRSQPSIPIDFSPPQSPAAVEDQMARIAEGYEDTYVTNSHHAVAWEAMSRVSVPARQDTPSSSAYAESMIFPMESAGAPSHVHLDPSFYDPNGDQPAPSSARSRSSSFASSVMSRPRQAFRPPPVPPLILPPQSVPWPSSSSARVTPNGEDQPSPLPSPKLSRRRGPSNPSNLARAPSTKSTAPSVRSTAVSVRSTASSLRRLPPPPLPTAPSQTQPIVIITSHLGEGTRPRLLSAGRSLPQTPMTPGSASSSSIPTPISAYAVLQQQQLGRERDREEKYVDRLAQWMGSERDERVSSTYSAFEIPPPAYNDINFGPQHGHPPA